MWARVLIIAAVLLAAVGPAVAAADADTQSAKAQYSLGMKRYNLGDYRAALEAFKAAYLAKPDPVFLFNVGQCQRQLADYAAAEKSYRAFLRESPDVAPAQREQVERLIAEMEKAQIEARSKQPPMGTQPPHEDAESSTARPPITAPVTSPEPTAAPSPAARDAGDEAARAARTKKIVGLVVGVAGLGLVGGGIACGVLAKQAGDDLTALDRAGAPFDKSKERSGQLDQTLSGVLLGIGGAAIVAGVVVGALGLKQSKTPARASFTPIVSPTAAGAVVTVSY